MSMSDLKNRLSTFPVFMSKLAMQQADFEASLDRWKHTMWAFFPDVTNEQLQRFIDVTCEVGSTLIFSKRDTVEYLLDEIKSLALHSVSIDDLLSATPRQWETYHKLSLTAHAVGISAKDLFMGILKQKSK